MWKTVLMWTLSGFIFFALLVGVEAGAYFYLQKTEKPFPFFYHPPPSMDRTYGSADDFRYTYYDYLSDWAHNPKQISLPEGWKLKQGYVENKPLDQNKQFKTLLIYGGSTSDLAFIHENWPFYLDRTFKERGQNVKIYIGAVAGIGASQELLRLLRDIRPIKPDLVISYSGINELDTTVEEQPMLTFFFNRVISRAIWPRPSTFLPNTNRLIQRMVVGEQMIQGKTFGKDYLVSRAENWKTHLNWMRLIAESENAQFLGILQPNVAVGKPHLAGRELETIKGFIAPRYPAFYNEALEYVKQSPHFRSFGQIFADRTDEIYFDDCHMSETGNRIVSENMIMLLQEVGF